MPRDLVFHDAQQLTQRRGNIFGADIFFLFVLLGVCLIVYIVRCQVARGAGGHVCGDLHYGTWHIPWYVVKACP